MGERFRPTINGSILRSRGTSVIIFSKERPERQSAYNTSRKAKQPSPLREPLYTELDPAMCMYYDSMIILANDRCPLARGFWTGSATGSEIGDFPFPQKNSNKP